jgi:hypothetical protein
LKQFAKSLGQPNVSTSNKWNKAWVAGFHVKNHLSIIRGQNRSKVLRDGSLHWQMVVVALLENFETWLPLEDFDTAKWIWRQWVEMFSKKCSSEAWKPRTKGERGNTHLVTD